MLWANLHLLFWLSLFPFATGWMGQNNFTAAPTVLWAGAADGRDRILPAEQTTIRAQGENSILKKAVGRDWKGRLSPALYLLAIVVTLRSPWIAQAVYVAAALIWLIPDRRIESVLSRGDA